MHILSAISTGENLYCPNRYDEICHSIVVLRMRKIRVIRSVMAKKRRIVEQVGNKLGHWSGRGESREFIALTNFGVRVLKFIEAPTQLPDYKGFLVEVTQDRKRSAVKGYDMLRVCWKCYYFNTVFVGLLIVRGSLA